MAIEDAYVLAECLALAPDEPGKALRLYEKRRRRRTARIQRAARNNDRIYHLGGASALIATSASAPLGGKMAARRYDWVYDWAPNPSRRNRRSSCSPPPSPAACRNRPGSPSRTSCGRHGGSSGADSTPAKLDATLLAIKVQEDAGIDIVSDGEQSRQHFVHGFLEFVDGIDFERQGRDGHPRRPLQSDGADRDRRTAAQGPRARRRSAPARAHTSASSSSPCPAR